MPLKLYSSLASWWHLMSPPDEYAEEANCYWRIMSQHATRPIETLLELGCGGGNNAVHLKQRCRMTLSDISPQMLDVSKLINPDCTHLEGDMRTMRLGRAFDAVFVHDAILYVLTEGDLLRAIRTAFEHCVPGGIALFVVDATREAWVSSTLHGGRDGNDRSMRYLEWNWDPDPSDTEYVADIVYILRERDGGVSIEHDRHRLGLFPTETWLKLLRKAGFQASAEPCRFTGSETTSAFLGRRKT